VEEEDVVDAVDEEDEAPRKKKGGITAKPSSRRRDEEDEEDEDDRPRKKRARDEEDEEDEDDRPRKKKSRDEDEDEDEDDRPSRKKGAKARRRDEDEDEEEEEDRPKISPKKRRAGLRKAATGAGLVTYGLWATVGAFGIAIILSLLYASLASSKGGGGGKTMVDIVGIINYLVALGLVVGIGLRIAGSAMIITTPGKNGEMGLGIACVSTAGLAAVMILLLIFKLLEIELLGKLLLFIIAVAEFNPFAGIEGATGAGVPVEFGFAVFILPLLEVAWLTLFALYQWGVGKSIKDRDLRSRGLLMVIVAPSTCGGMGLFMFLMGKVIKATSLWVPMMFLVLYLMVIAGMLVWYALAVTQTKASLEYAR
jgi:hypothetical protein